jgi:hypothetical protein
MVEQTPKTDIIEGTQTLWETNRHPEGCMHCHRIFLVQPSSTGSTCPLCRRGNLEAQPARMRKTEPEWVLPYRFGQKKLQAIYEKFVSGVWIKPEDCNPESLLRKTVPVFWPMWLVDSDISGHWQMETGFDYQVESSKEYYAGGQWQSRKQIENRIRWEPRLGQLNTHIENVAAPALEEHQNRKELTGPYLREGVQAFDPGQLGSAFLEVPDLPPEDAWPLAKPQVDQTAAKICVEAAGAQHQRNFMIKAEYNHLHWTEFLLPMYATFYTDDDGQPQIVIVNGETGVINGPRLASQKRGLRIAGIIAGVAGLLFILTLISLLLSLIFPTAAVLAALLGIMGFAIGIAAIVPAVWPGQWNRKQDGPRITTKP